MTKRVLVIGATGAFGPTVVSRFEKLGDFTVFASGRRCQREGKYVPCDVRIRTQIEELLDQTRPDIIIHLAGTLSSDFDEAVAVNVQASRMLLETVQQRHKNTRVVLMGSAAEYGIVHPEDNPISEMRSLAPVSVYGLTKAWQSQLVSLFAGCGVDVVEARGFNLDGPGLTERLFVGRLQRQIDAVKSGRKQEIEVGNLSSVRDYISFGDAAMQMEAIALYGQSGLIYHVASGVPVSVRDILIRHLFNNGLDTSLVRESEAFSNHVGYDVPMIYADISRTKQLLSSAVLSSGTDL